MKDLLDKNGYVEALLRKHLPDEYASSLLRRLTGNDYLLLQVRWINEAELHDSAADRYRADAYDEEWALHMECARILRRCANELDEP